MKLTPEQLAELIAKVFASISEKRKAASKEADPAPADDSIGTDEILSAVSEILGDLGEPADPGAKADDTADTQTGEAEISPRAHRPCCRGPRLPWREGCCRAQPAEGGGARWRLREQGCGPCRCLRSRSSA